MKIAEIYKLELHNKDSCFLVKDGIFWRAYEKSAMWYCINVKEYQITVKYYKNIRANLVYLGFPDTGLDSTLERCEKKGLKINRIEELIEINGFDVIEKFDDWKNSIEKNSITVEEQKEPYVKAKTSDKVFSKVEEKIRTFPLASKTPIECQQFLFEIQNQLNGNL